ncbi:MAG TPA: hypothetical protein PKA29_02845 [Candidatus Saccharibacteria bacterium]|jgi:hypothetical protein|nr:hypothetical protein [Candidatus Saccharibacteria bacterium]
MGDSVVNQEAHPEFGTEAQPELPGRKELAWIKRGVILGHLIGWLEGRRGDSLSLSMGERVAAKALALVLSQNRDAISPELLNECNVVAETDSSDAQIPSRREQNIDLAMHASQRIERMPLLFRWWFRRNSAGGNGVTGDDYINALARWDNLKDILRLSFKVIPAIGLLGLVGYGGYKLGDSDDSVDLRAVEQNAWENNTTGLRTPTDKGLLFNEGQRYLDLSRRDIGTGGFNEGTLEGPVIGFGLRLPGKDGSDSWLPQPPAGSEWAVGNMRGTEVAFPIPATTGDSKLRPEVTATFKECADGSTLVFAPTSGETVVAGTLDSVSPELASNVESGEAVLKPSDSCP